MLTSVLLSSFYTPVCDACVVPCTISVSECCANFSSRIWDLCLETPCFWYFFCLQSTPTLVCLSIFPVPKTKFFCFGIVYVHGLLYSMYIIVVRKLSDPVVKILWRLLTLNLMILFCFQIKATLQYWFQQDITTPHYTKEKVNKLHRF